MHDASDPGTMGLILASASPRRAELLRAAGYAFDVVAVDIDETVRDGESPAAYVRRLAAEKSFVVSGFPSLTLGAGPSTALGARPSSARGAGSSTALGAGSSTALGAGGHVAQSGAIILGADTTVVVDGEILGKPRDDREAADMLRRLSRRRHEVLTGVSLRRGAFEVGRVETTSVYVAALSDADIAWYVASGEGRDKAGAYAIQGLASRFISRIEGSYSNVVGLPIAAVHELIGQLGR